MIVMKCSTTELYPNNYYCYLYQLTHIECSPMQGIVLNSLNVLFYLIITTLYVSQT